MPGDTQSMVIAVFALIGVVLLLIAGARPLRFRGRPLLPKRFEGTALEAGAIPPDTEGPLQFLIIKLSQLGFECADEPMRVPSMDRFGYKLWIVPFVHLDEHSYFLLGIESGLGTQSHLMLHILTPLTEGRRVETSTLQPLEMLLRPPKVEAEIVLDADSVEELWSRHRKSLSRHVRADRAPVAADLWRAFMGEAYEGWVQSAIRGHRLQLSKNGTMYRIRGRPKSVI